ncbi:Lipopolysaccharide core biosynthesis protein rfaG [Achromobacter denitrificans]|uniref:glycosyltransferase family 4 protein n=1 Tax=Achromobacter denitrificans TaxID=32002 RepID=UPI0007876A0A|nr:glycosyltransferase family 4 protein [Achromobacter denitrificans]OLU08292.1 transferase [Achromobacter denitrificans]QKH40218.1 glycosyltransferase family 4 protein [Achromobacter denitrificans]QKH52637.1 glycosyltransferase family 4 protein [Achromobacter denitrificans]CAB3718328.1 Lipopolysaccharide core biosynthesis protein RfaG [Achromobacter denitrificans]SUW33441.1 Lipopolysaccharide core biosynthesis protein rfaG [Achromobacter denitrificans]
MKTPAGAVERRLRIALLVDRFGNRFGGAEAYGVELMRVLGQRHDVSVVARDFDSDLPFPFLPVRFPAWLPSWMRVLYFAWRADRLTRGRYDIVHSHMNGWAGEIQVMHVTPVRYNRLTRVKPLQRLTAWLSPRLATYLLLEKLRVRAVPARRVVAVSGLIMDQLHRSYGPQLPVDIIAPGVKLPTAAQREGREETRARLGWDAETIGCLLVARNPLRKGLPALLDALGQLPPQYRLLVVGADEPTRERVWAAGAIASRVTLIDPTPDVARYFSAADIYAHPTLNDSYGMAPLEAMSHGLPVVVSSPAYCGFAQYLSAGKDALILQDPRNGAQLAQALERLGSEPDLRAALAERGLAIAREQSWEAVASRYEDLYAQVLRERGQAGA